MALLTGRRATFLAGGAAGALAAYFFDPARGKLRRHRLRDQAAAGIRRSGRRAERTARYAGTTMSGKVQALQHREPEAPLDDQTLAHKVESELFGDRDIPKGQININAEDGVVVLRGQVQTPDLLKDIEGRVRRIEGVRGVENMLHLPGTPAPNKREARMASGPGGPPTG